MICGVRARRPAASARDDAPACRTLYVFQAHTLDIANPVYACTRRAPSSPALTRPRCSGSACRLLRERSVKYRVEGVRVENRSEDIGERWTASARHAMQLTLWQGRCHANQSPL